MSASETTGYCPVSEVQTVAHAVKLLKLRAESQSNAGLSLESTSRRECRKTGSSIMVTRVHPLIALAAITTVSPAPASEQKQDEKNNQYGFHVVPHL
jgi:hypothetical protein